MATATRGNGVEGATGDGSVITSHQFHARAHALSGHLHHPVYQRINEQALVTIHDERGGHILERENNFTLEGVVSFESAHSRVAGNRSLKTNGWVTLSTSIVEGLNVLEVITADRMVSQVSTEHPQNDGHVPHVTFLGSQFVHLRLSGFEITPKFNFGICGPKPPGTTPYVRHVGFLENTKAQLKVVVGKLQEHLKAIARSPDNEDQALLPRDQPLLNLLNKALNEYIGKLKDVEQRITNAKDYENGNHEENGKTELVTCSLIDTIDIDHIPIPGLRTAGHLLFIPEFGTVALGQIAVSSTLIPDDYVNYDNHFELKMIDMDLGCIGDGEVSAATAAANGHTKP